MLFEDDSDTEVSLQINKGYADKYNVWRQKEELMRLKAKYGDTELKKEEDSSSESSSSDDEDAEQLTEQLEKDFFKTLSCLKKKDPRIYDEKTKFFSELTPVESQKRNHKKEEKPMFLRDYERKLILERDGKFSDDEDEADKNKRPESPTIVEKERLLKEDFKGALQDSDEDNDEAWGGLFQKREKTKAEEEKEEEDYKEWLKGQKEEIEDKETESDLKYLHDYWNDPNLSSGEKFLKDYILNKRFLEEGDEDHIPTYDEVIHDSDDNLSEDEKTIEKQEEFERKFNFRFEEPDQDFIKRFPRTMENSLRAKNDRRKRKREEVRQRKEAEKTTKRQELNRLKALKRQEIIDKIEKLKEITGNEEVGFRDEDLESDFNPEQHDKRMNQLFTSEYYEGVDEQKPEFPDLDEELEMENWDDWNGENSEDYYQSEEVHEPHCEDPDFNMDCDYNPTRQFQKELIEWTKSKKGKKWKNKLSEALARKKPVFDSRNQTFEEYMDSYYKLDYEDLIGDLPCRFKYRKVTPNNFGLSVEEILNADDKELNAWCSLKKAFIYRPEHVEKYDFQEYKKKAKNKNLKKKVLPSLFEEPTENEISTKKRKHSEVEDGHTDHGKTKKKKKKGNSIKEDDGLNEGESNNIMETSEKNKKKKKKENSVKDDDGLSSLVINKENRESDLTESPKKKKTENSAKEDGDLNYEVLNKENEESNITETAVKKKKKKKKNKQSIEGNSSASQETRNSDVIESRSAANSEVQNSNDNQSSNVEGKKKRKKKKKKKNKAEEGSSNSKPQGNNGAFNKNKKSQFSKNKKGKFQKRFQTESEGPTISDARLRAYGIRPKAYRNKLKYGNTW